MWAERFEEYLGSYEVRLHRRTKTFGGLLWPAVTSRLITPERQLEIALAATEGAGA